MKFHNLGLNILLQGFKQNASNLVQAHGFDHCQLLETYIVMHSVVQMISMTGSKLSMVKEHQAQWKYETNSLTYSNRNTSPYLHLKAGNVFIQEMKQENCHRILKNRFFSSMHRSSPVEKEYTCSRVHVHC